MHILPYMTTYMTVGIFSKKNKSRPFFQNPKSTKIKLITASIHEKNTKYLTKCEFVYFDVKFPKLE